jgi:hypothetical protein
MNPSLLLIPDRYKAAKLYSQIPDSGAGDLTFARNSSATRINSAGLIEKVRTNVILQSQAFETASWSSSFAGTGIAPVITANNATAPDGSMTADTIVFNAGAGTTSSDSSGIFQVITANGLFCGSFFARVASGTGQLMCRHVGGSSYTTLNLTTTWQRFSVVETGSTGFFEITIRRGLNEPINASVTAQLWGAQLEAGDIATDYIPTTTAAVSVGITADIPRLDYTGGGCPSLLLEPQRTNSARNSILTAANWDKSSITVTAGSGIAPTGFNEAYRVAPTTSGTDRFFYDDGGSTGYTASADYTNTIFAKASGLNFCYARFEIKGNTSSFVYFNLATGAVGSTVGDVPIVKSIENYGNGWYRIRVTGNMGTGIGGANNVLFGVCDADGSTFATTSGSNGVLFYGPQSELGSYPTSYIPTLGSSVTRLADAASKTGISSLIGQSEGTLYAEIPLQYLNFANFRGIISASDGTFDNGAFVFVNNDGGTSNQFSSVYRSAGSSVAVFQAANLSAGNIGSTYKIAIAYKANDFVFYINGVQIGSDTSGSITGTLSQLDLGSISYTGLSTIDRQSIAASAIYPVRLSNSQLASLTSL